MLATLFCLAVAYLALTAHQSGAAAMAVHLPAIAVVIAARWLPPGLAAACAFGIGLCLDALGRGPLGVHAAAMVGVVWLVIPLLRDGERRTVFRAIGAVALVVLVDGLASMSPQLLANRAAWPVFGIELAKMLGVTAAAAGILASLGQRIFGTPCTIR